MKKIFLILIMLLSMSLMISCENESTTVILPSLDGMSREEIKETLDPLKIKYSFQFAKVIINSDDELDKFVSYSGDYTAGSTFDKSKFLYVYTTVLPLTFHNHEQVKINFDYENKSFVKDGVGKVTLARLVDGDTAHFYDITGEYIKLRFLLIDTPESTKDKDPWGLAASNYTKDKLLNAKEIVLESDTEKMDTYGRYLGYVWVDGVLLNLLLVEEAYTNASPSHSKYKEYFMEANMKAKTTGRRFFGEVDPNYDYENKEFK